MTLQEAFKRQIDGSTGISEGSSALNSKSNLGNQWEVGDHYLIGFLFKGSKGDIANYEIISLKESEFDQYEIDNESPRVQASGSDAFPLIKIKDKS